MYFTAWIALQINQDSVNTCSEESNFLIVKESVFKQYSKDVLFYAR